MITYAYWLVLMATVLLVIYLGKSAGKPTIGLGIAAFLAFAGWSMYTFYFEQMFVKRFGGSMTISVPEGQTHINATWKDDNLWINNYNPKTNTCYFRETSRGNVLEGQVVIKNCSPLYTK